MCYSLRCRFQIDVVLVAHRFPDPIGDAACRNGEPDFCKGLANLSCDMVSTIFIANDRGQSDLTVAWHALQIVTLVAKVLLEGRTATKELSR